MLGILLHDKRNPMLTKSLISPSPSHSLPFPAPILFHLSPVLLPSSAPIQCKELPEVTKISPCKLRRLLRDGRQKEIFSVNPRFKGTSPSSRIVFDCDARLCTSRGPTSARETQVALSRRHQARISRSLEVEHPTIRLMEPKPSYSKLYQMSPAELTTVREYIQKNLNVGNILPSSSPFGAPLFFAREKDDSRWG